ncbi:hypothetical protein FOPG_19012, partial [Fusarium oxysporum f. sp. conglutinans race 2 54008]
ESLGEDNNLGYTTSYSRRVGYLDEENYASGNDGPSTNYN